MSLLAGLDVLVLDCQATGASPAFGHVLELGWGVVRAAEGRVEPAEAHWIALPQGHVVPRQVRKLTGWDPRSAAPALDDREAWRRVRAAVSTKERVPTVIHFARFELAFLREWAARFEPDVAFPLEAVCLHDIAHRVLPELPRLSLRALAGYCGYSLHLARRSLGHVEATAFVWQYLLAALASRGISTWDELRAWLAEKPAVRPRPRKPAYPIARERYRSLPDAPGVYRFLRRNGDVLYVGKAASLRKRTSSHFVGRAGKLLAPEMLTQVHDIAFTEVASALEAALLENDTIKTLRPPYNVQLTDGEAPVWYASRDFREVSLAPSDRHVVGPLPSAFSLRPLVALGELLTDKPREASLRADAVGVSALWTPEAAVFEAGWALLCQRHAGVLDELRGKSEWTEATSLPTRALRFARVLSASAAAAEVESDEDDADDHAWDPERVARHIERAAAQAHRLHQRARWLRLVRECAIVYREPEATRARRLVLRDGAIVEACDAEGATSAALAPASGPDLSVQGTAVFDRARYDRLRILTSELKRIVRDGGEVGVWLPGRTRPLAATLVRGVLRAV